ncbi:MAG: phosphodiesterase [Dorea sp.]|uniref:phosphodiesterase n=1 Tax=Sporofaciens musculi TaxID=2681861 RepID=UPI002172C478|nr:phosphodiesterase [Sporofaciens musculi]MCI9422121.1 phosphodiesterase [Dorea sp.]
MKIMIASDIHGSAYYLRQLLEQYKAEQPDKLLLLGDILYHGPRNDLPKGYAPKEVIDLLNPMKEDILCVRGNCDTDVDQMVLEFPILADYCILYEQGHMIFATHGHIHNTANPPMLKKGDILLHGHTHIPVAEDFDGRYYLNPGSISIPKEASEHSYMMLENGVFTWKTLAGQSYRHFDLENGLKNESE